MTQIELPFSREMAIAAIEGKKVATTRSEPKGDYGDTFEVGHPDVPKSESCKYFATPKFRILDILPRPLDDVKSMYFRLEGFDSPVAFEKTWRSLHRGHYVGDKEYYVHFFARVI
jgi:hypothetical protein